MFHSENEPGPLLVNQARDHSAHQCSLILWCYDVMMFTRSSHNICVAKLPFLFIVLFHWLLSFALVTRRWGRSITKNGEGRTMNFLSLFVPFCRLLWCIQLSDETCSNVPSPACPITAFKIVLATLALKPRFVSIPHPVLLNVFGSALFDTSIDLKTTEASLLMETWYLPIVCHHIVIIFFPFCPDSIKNSF